MTFHIERQAAQVDQEISSPSESKGLEKKQIKLVALPPRFCQKSGPNNFSTSSDKLLVGFRSNKKVEAEGAECTIACSDKTPAKTSSGVCVQVVQVEGEYERASPSNDWHYVTISKKNENVFIWKNKAGVEWDLTLDGEERVGVLRFKVRLEMSTKTKL